MDSVTLSALTRMHAGWVEARQALVARNIASVDVPGARTHQVESFSTLLERSATGAGAGMMATHDRHTASKLHTGSVASVSSARTPVLEREMIAMTETRRAHELNIAIAGAFHRMQIAAVKA